MIEPPADITGTAARTKLVTLPKFSSTSIACTLGAGVEEVRVEGAGRVVDHDVDLAPLLRDPPDERVDGIGVADVEHLGNGATPERFELRHGLLLAGVLTVAHGDIGTEAGEPQCDGSADALGRRR